MSNIFHLTAQIDTIRHGEKSSDGNLTQKGAMQAALKAIEVDNLQGDIWLYHSGSSRVKDTVIALSRNIGISSQDFVDKDIYNKIIGLDATDVTHLNVTTIEESKLHYLLDPKKKSEYFAPWSELLKDQEAAARAQNFLNFHDESPEPDVIPSPKGMAKRLMEVILKQLDEAKKTEYFQSINFINGTHEPVLMSFL